MVGPTSDLVPTTLFCTMLISQVKKLAGVFDGADFCYVPTQFRQRSYPVSQPYFFFPVGSEVFPVFLLVALVHMLPITMSYNFLKGPTPKDKLGEELCREPTVKVPTHTVISMHCQSRLRECFVCI